MYTRGLHQLGDHTWAWLQPDGSWGWSNAGLIVDGDQALLVDTLYDLKNTAEMLSAMKRAVSAPIETVVNTHANGDHCYGNVLVDDATILSTAAAAAEMAELPPSKMAQLMTVARVLSALPWPLSEIPIGPSRLGALGRFVRECFSPFDFAGVELRLPDQTFSGETTVAVGDLSVQLVEVGPAHTRGDALVYVPAARTIYTGDILFHGGMPVIWDGPIENWIAACDRILALEVDVVVPGHGPVTGPAAVADLRAHLTWLRDGVAERFAAGQSQADITAQLSRELDGTLTERERLAVNVDTLYRAHAGRPRKPSPFILFAQMAALASEMR